MKYQLTVIVFLYSSVTVISQTKRNLEVNDLFNSYNIIDAKFSPDNRYAAIVIERPRKDQILFGINFINRYDLYLMDIANKKLEIILDGGRDSCSYWNPVWSPDSKKIAVLSTKGQDNIRAYIYQIDYQQLTKVHSRGVNLMTKTFSGASGLNDPIVWRDSNNLITSVLAPGAADSKFSVNSLSLEITRREWTNMQLGLSETSSSIDSDSLHLFPSDQSSYLIKYSLQEDKSIVLDTGFFRHIILSPDKSKLLFVKRNGGTKLGNIEILESPWNFNHEMGILDLGSLQKFTVPSEIFNATVDTTQSPYVWGEDGGIVFIKNSENMVNGFLTLKNQRITKLAVPHNLVYSQGHMLNLKNSYLKVNPTDGKLEPIKFKSRVLDSTKVSESRESLASSDNALFQLQAKKDSTGLQLLLTIGNSSTVAHSFNSWVRQIKDVRREFVDFIDGYGNNQKALLLYPNNDVPKNQIIVSCYPGQKISTLNYSGIWETNIGSDSFDHLLIFTSKGYHVLIPTILTQGSDDYFEFQKSILPALNETCLKLSKPKMEAHLFGLSYGGYCVYSVLTQTNRFKSGIVLAGFCDLVSSYGNFDIRWRYSDNPFETIQRLKNPESGQGGLGVPFHKNPLKYIRNSPLFYSDKIQTPILIIHGDRDFVSIEQAEQMFTSLLRQGKKTRFVRLWGEGHNINSPQNIKAMWREILEWIK